MFQLSFSYKVYFNYFNYFRIFVFSKKYIFNTW